MIYYLFMNERVADLEAEIRTLLRRRGLLTSAELQQATGKSQATISRALDALEPDVVAIGKARSTRYALPKSIMAFSGEQALYLTGASGASSRWGTLYFLDEDRLHVTAASGSFNITTQADLPWFLAPLRPQGFLGRLRGQSLGFSDSNPDNWTLEQVLFALIAHEHDHPGAFSVGEERGELLPEAPLDLALRATFYDDLAQNVNQTLPAGSSAGGEQPKFLAHIDTPTGYERLIVKFSPPRGTPFGERWHDLLHTELIALRILKRHGFAVADARIVQSDRRTYLESVRFDRIGEHGKRHVVPLSAVHRAFVSGIPQHWAATGEALAKRGLLSATDAAQIRTLREFGRLIGNTDMHFGNLSLCVDDLELLAKPQLRLAPVYDMLSMAWKPGEFRDELGYTAMSLPQPPLGAASAWNLALQMAQEFWQTMSELQAVSAELRAIAHLQAQRVLSAR